MELDHKVLPDHKVLEEQLDHKGHLDPQDLQVRPVLQEEVAKEVPGLEAPQVL
jgi:hypothetical protein